MLQIKYCQYEYVLDQIDLESNFNEYYSQFSHRQILLVHHFLCVRVCEGGEASNGIAKPSNYVHILKVVIKCNLSNASTHTITYK